MIGSSFRRFALGMVALALPMSASAELLRLGPSWHFLRFDEPCTLVNQGTKFTVFNIVNPKTGRWELVWGECFWDETWVRDYLKFDGRSDDVRKTVRILKPVTIAVVVFGFGETEAEVDKAPAVNIRRKTGPRKNTRPDDILQPRVAGKKPEGGRR